MAKTQPKPQPVKFRAYGYGMYAENETGSTARELYALAIYDEAGIIATMSADELKKHTSDEPARVCLPIVWKTKQAPDYSEPRAHFIACTVAFQRKYVLLIPAQSVTITSTSDRPARYMNGIHRTFTVEEFPAPFKAFAAHPFNCHAAIEALEDLTRDQYHILTIDEINTPSAQARINEFVELLTNYRDEAARLYSISDEEYAQECSIDTARYYWDSDYNAAHRIEKEPPSA